MARDPYRTLGAEDGYLDFDNEEIECDEEDLLARYVGNLPDPHAAFIVATEEAARYMAKVDRAITRADTQTCGAFADFLKRHQPDGTPAAQRAIYEIYKAGYHEGLLRAISEFLVEAAADDDADVPLAEREGAPLRTNPGGDEPVAYWESQGRWDSGHTFDSDTWDSVGLDLDDYVERVFDEQGQIDPRRLQAATGQLADDILRAMNDPREDHKEEWLHQNRDTIREFGHLESVAWDLWSRAYVNQGRDYIAKHLDEAAQRWQDDNA